MTPEIKERLEKLMQFLEDTAIQSKDFVVEQTPLVVQEFLAWEFWSNIMLSSVLAVMMVVSVITIRYGIKKIRIAIADATDDNVFISILWGALAITGGLFIIFSSNPMYNSTKNAVKVKVAPRVYLIEHIADITKGENNEPKK